MDSTSNRSLQSYIQEGIVIVASILVAFAIDAFWARYQESRVEERILLELHDEFESSRERILGSIAELDRSLSASATLLNHLGPATADLSREAAEDLLGEILWGNTLEVPSSVLDSTVASGQLRLITNNRLRKALSDWPSLVADVRENHDWHRQATDEAFVPYIAKFIAVRTAVVSSGYLESNRSTFNLDPAPLQRDPVFEGLLSWRASRQFATHLDSTVLLSAASEVLVMIEHELDLDLDSS